MSAPARVLSRRWAARLVAAVGLGLPVLVAACAKPRPGRVAAVSSSATPHEVVSSAAPPASSSFVSPLLGLASPSDLPSTLPDEAGAGKIEPWAQAPPGCFPQGFIAVGEKHAYITCQAGILARVPKEGTAKGEIIHKGNGENYFGLFHARGRLFFATQNFNGEPKLGTVMSMPADGGPVLIHEGRFIGPTSFGLLEKGVIAEEADRLSYIPASGGAVVSLVRTPAGVARVWGTGGEWIAWEQQHPVPNEPHSDVDFRGVVLYAQKVPRGTPKPIAKLRVASQQIVVDDGVAWVLAADGQIDAVPLDGSTPPRAVAHPAAPLQGLVAHGEHLYAFSQSSELRILRVPKRGGTMKVIGVEPPLGGVIQITLDGTHAYVGRAHPQLSRLALPR